MCNSVFPHTLYAGWIESALAVLRWSLEHQPPGFLQTIAIPLVGLLYRYREMFKYLRLPLTPLHLKHLPGTLAVMKEYHLYLSSTAADRIPASVAEKVAMSVTRCQANALTSAWAGGHESTDVESQRLMINPFMVEAALLKVAGWCQLKQQGRIKLQQQTIGPFGKRNECSRGKRNKHGSSSSTSSSTIRSSRAAAAAAGFEARSSTSTSSSSNSRGEPESSMSAAAAVPGSYAQLGVILEDHFLVAASLGSKAVSCYSTMASFYAASVGDVKGAGGLMGFAGDAMFVLQTASSAESSSTSSSSGNTTTSSSTISISSSSHAGSSTSTPVCGTVSTAKLLLEALALSGAEMEDGMNRGDGMNALIKTLALLQFTLQLCPRTELEAFISERGSLLLQVLSLMLDMIQPHELLLQQPAGARWGQLLQVVVSFITYLAKDESCCCYCKAMA